MKRWTREVARVQSPARCCRARQRTPPAWAACPGRQSVRLRSSQPGGLVYSTCQCFAHLKAMTTTWRPLLQRRPVMMMMMMTMHLIWRAGRRENVFSIEFQICILSVRSRKPDWNRSFSCRRRPTDRRTRYIKVIDCRITLY